MHKLGDSDIKTVIGSCDNDVSREFYVAMGFKLTLDAGDITEPELGNCRFNPQN